MSLAGVKVGMGGGNYEPITPDKWVGCACIGMAYHPVTEKDEAWAKGKGWEAKPQFSFRFEVDEKIAKGELAGLNKEATLWVSVGLYSSVVGGKGKDSNLFRFLSDYLKLTPQVVMDRFLGDAEKIQLAVVGTSGELKGRADGKGGVRLRAELFQPTQPGREPFRSTNAARKAEFPPKDGPGASPEASTIPAQGQGAPPTQEPARSNATTSAGVLGMGGWLQKAAKELGGMTHDQVAEVTKLPGAKVRIAWQGQEPSNERFELTADEVTLLCQGLMMEDDVAQGFRLAWTEKRR